MKIKGMRARYPHYEAEGFGAGKYEFYDWLGRKVKAHKDFFAPVFVIAGLLIIVVVVLLLWNLRSSGL